MDLPSSAHFIYIPGVLILGLVLGFIWGARVTREAFVLEQKRLEERARRKAERAAAQSGSDSAAPAGAGPGHPGPQSG
jgi:hypothetical protein